MHVKRLSSLNLFSQFVRILEKSCYPFVEMLQNSRRINKKSSPPALSFTIRHQNQQQQQRLKHLLQKQKDLLLRARKILAQQYLGQQRRDSDWTREAHNLNDDYLSLDDDSELLYATRMQHLKNTKITKPKRHHRPRVPSSSLFNFANSGTAKGQKTIVTYDQATQLPTEDLQHLVLLLIREHFRKEIFHLNEIVNEQNPFEMRNMRFKSYIANTQDIMDHWKSAMLGEGMRVIDDSFEFKDVAWIIPGQNQQLPMFVDEQMLVSVPPDRPEISKAQVASEYIQAQRGQRQDLEDSMQLFQNEILKSENAVLASPELLDRIMNCHRLLAQKVAEIEYIEKKPETVQAVSNYMGQIRSSVVQVVQESMTQNLVDAVEQGRNFVRTLASKIMDELHANHAKRDFDPWRVTVIANRPDGVS